MGVAGPAALTAGPLRYAEVKRALTGVSDRMLSQALHRLEADGLVSRTSHGTVPPRVDYELTALGEPIAAAVCGLIDAIYQ